MNSTDVLPSIDVALYCLSKYMKTALKITLSIRPVLPILDIFSVKGNVRVTCEVVPWLRRLVAGFPPRRSRFEPRSRYVGFVVDKMALGIFFSEYFDFLCQFSFHRLLLTKRETRFEVVRSMTVEINVF
jgi:hypothetical protein